MASRRPSRSRRSGAGFTLVEVLVALSIMAVIAGLGWRGIDTMVRSRDVAQAASERTLRLGTVMAQWEQDLQATFDTGAVPALAFDGSTLRLTRRVDGGVQMVAWSVQSGVWRRWASPTVQRQGDLQEAWLRSQQLQGQEDGQIKLFEGAAGWQLYYFQGNAWSNAQSTGNVNNGAGAAAPPAPAASGAAGTPRVQLPNAVRMVLTLPEGPLTRDVMLGSQT